MVEVIEHEGGTITIRRSAKGRLESMWFDRKESEVLRAAFAPEAGVKE